MKVPNFLENPVDFHSSGFYFLPLTEFKFETTLIGFEIYSLSPNNQNIWTYVLF